MFLGHGNVTIQEDSFKALLGDWRLDETSVSFKSLESMLQINI
jgi:hypothetical protein